MLDTTKQALAAILAADPTVSPEERKARLAPNLAATDTEPTDRILSPVETGKLLGGRDRHTIANWEKRGLLVAVRTGAGGKRITGYTRSSVAALLAGKTQTEAKPAPSANPTPHEPIF